MSKSSTYLASKPRYEILDGLRGVAAVLFRDDLLIFQGGRSLFAKSFVYLQQESVVQGHNVMRHHTHRH